MLTALQHEFLRKVAQVDLGAELPEPGRFAAGIIFLPRLESEREVCKQTVARIIQRRGKEQSTTTRQFIEFLLRKARPTSEGLVLSGAGAGPVSSRAS